MPSEEGIVHRGSASFFAEQGVEDPDRMRVEIMVQYRIAAAIEVLGPNLLEAAMIAGCGVERLSAITAETTTGVEVWTLMNAAASVGSNIVINVGLPGSAPGMIRAQLPEAAGTDDG